MAPGFAPGFFLSVSSGCSIHICAVALVACPTPAGAARVAIVIASDQGQSHEVKLRYSESDAERLARVLTRLGGFPDDATLLLRGPSAQEVRRALAEVNRRLSATPGDPLIWGAALGLIPSASRRRSSRTSTHLPSEARRRWSLLDRGASNNIIGIDLFVIVWLVYRTSGGQQ